ncbi:MAG: hypothetical protein OXG04_20825 [Acidobacteria bacterium]|nr:hypothetical protein [Acidobacteriota bacterium]
MWRRLGTQSDGRIAEDGGTSDGAWDAPWRSLAQQHPVLPVLLERAMSRGEDDPNPFIDRAGYLAHIDMQEQRFEEMLREQQAAR